MFKLKYFFVTLIFAGCSQGAVKSVRGTEGETPIDSKISTNSTTQTQSTSKTSTSTAASAQLSFEEGSSYSFGVGMVGATIEKIFTLRNSGAVAAATVTASVSSPFAFKGGAYPGTGGTCSATLAQSASCTIVVTFSSATVVVASSTLSVSYSGSTSSISLSATAAKFSAQQKIVGKGAAGRAASDYFGWSVSIYGDTLAVGAYQQDYDQNGANMLGNAGTVFIYTRSNGAWTLQQRVVGQGTNGRVSLDQFGYSVSLYGDLLAVGANGHGYDEAGANSLAGAGAVYIFSRNNGTWNFETKLVGTGTNGRVSADSFGFVVSLYSDTLAVSAYGQDTDEAGNNNITDTGAVFVFIRSSGGTWSVQQKIVGQGSNGRVTGDYFGYKLNLNADTLAVGAPYSDYDELGNNLLSSAGAVFVYTRSSGTWSLQQKLVGTGTNGRLGSDLFGIAVSVYEDTLAVGAQAQNYDESGGSNVTDAGAVYVFTRSSGSWSLQQKVIAQGTNGRVATDSFGRSVALYGDVLAVGSLSGYDENGANNLSVAGAVFVYTRNAGAWTYSQKIVGTGTNGRNASDYFGSVISLTSTSMAIGAYAHTYDDTGANSLAWAGAAWVQVLQ